MDPQLAPQLVRSMPTWLLSRATMRGSRLVTERLQALGVPSKYHYSLLAALAEYGPASQADLGRWTKLDRSDVTAAIGALEERGYVERAADPADRRRNLVRLTGAGAEFVEVLHRELLGVQDELLSALSAEEREALVDMLARIAGPGAGAGEAGADDGMRG